jgi:hypothetical protein
MSIKLHPGFPVPLDLVLYQGDDFLIFLDVMNLDGTAADLTGCSAKSVLRYGAADYFDALLELPCPITGNRITVAIDSDTSYLLTSTYMWDLELTNASGKVTTLVSGTVSMTQEVSYDGV